MKNLRAFLIFSFSMFILSLASVSAYYLPSVGQIGHEIVYTITDIFEPILYALFGSYSSGYIFETFLLFLLIASFVYLALGKIPILHNQKAVRNILTVAIPLLSVRWIDYEWFITIMSTYKILGIVITCILPFILYFYFLYNASEDHGVIRKMGWILWIAIYLGLWTSEYTSDLNSLVYFWAFVAGGVCLLGDNMINRRLKVLQSMKNDQYFSNREIGRLNMQISEIQEQLTRGAIDKKTAEKAIKDLHSHIEWLRKQ